MKRGGIWYSRCTSIHRLFEDVANAVPGIMQIVHDNDAEYDYFIVGCHLIPI